MMEKINIRQAIGAQLIRAGQLILPDTYKKRDVVDENFKFWNPFVAQVIRKGRVVQVARGINGVTVVGKHHFLDVTFGNSTPVTQIATWYIGLINNTPSPVLSENDTLASHSGWTEWTSYSGNRKAWNDANAANKIKGSSATSDFTISATGTLYGILVAGVDTGTSSILWSTGAFDTVLNVVNTDVVKITYGIRL